MINSTSCGKREIVTSLVGCASIISYCFASSLWGYREIILEFSSWKRILTGWWLAAPCPKMCESQLDAILPKNKYAWKGAKSSTVKNHQLVQFTSTIFNPKAPPWHGYPGGTPGRASNWASLGTPTRSPRHPWGSPSTPVAKRKRWAAAIDSS